MSKNRLLGGSGHRGRASRRRRCSRRPSRRARSLQSTSDTVKLGFITKFPVDFYFTLVNAAKKWDKATPGAKVIYASGKSGTDDAGEIAAIQNMVAQGVKGIAITPTSPAVSAALDKAIKAGVKVVLMDNDIPTWKKKSSVVATNNFKGGLLAGQVPRHEAQGGRHARGARGQSRGNPALVERVTGMLAGLGAMKEQDQGRLEARDRLRPDQGRHRGPDDPDGEPEPDGDVLGLRAAGARRDPVDQERRHQARTGSSWSASTPRPTR